MARVRRAAPSQANTTATAMTKSTRSRKRSIDSDSGDQKRSRANPKQGTQGDSKARVRSSSTRATTTASSSQVKGTKSKGSRTSTSCVARKESVDHPKRPHPWQPFKGCDSPMVVSESDHTDTESVFSSSASSASPACSASSRLSFTTTPTPSASKSRSSTPPSAHQAELVPLSPSLPPVSEDGQAAASSCAADSLPALSEVFDTACFGGSEYLESFIDRLWEADDAGESLANRERRRDPSSTIDKHMRHCLVDWMVHMAVELKVESPVTIHLAVHLLDRALDKLPVRREKFQLMGVTCFLLAAKVEETDSPTLEEMVEWCKDTYSRREIISYELVVCKAVDYRLCPIATLPAFLDHFLKVAQANKQQSALAWYLADLSLVHYHFTGAKASELAAAIVFAVRQATARAVEGPGAEPWTPALRHYARVADGEADLAPLVELLGDVLQGAWSMPYLGVPEKHEMAACLGVSDVLRRGPDAQALFWRGDPAAIAAAATAE